MILRLIFLLIIIYLLYKVTKGLLPFGTKKSVRSEQSIKVMEDLVEDPYCHSYTPISSAYQASINGKRVYFCSQKCFHQYMNDKEKRGDQEPL